MTTPDSHIKPIERLTERWWRR